MEEIVIKQEEANVNLAPIKELSENNSQDSISGANEKKAVVLKWDCNTMKIVEKESFEEHFNLKTDLIQQENFISKTELKAEYLIGEFNDELCIENEAIEIKTEEKELIDFIEENHLPKCHFDSPDQKFLKCEVCGYRCRQKRALRFHMLIHKDPSEVNWYRCGLCPYTSKVIDELEAHIRVHKSITEAAYLKNLSRLRIEKFRLNNPSRTSEKNDRKPNFCYFCKKEVFNFARHIMRNHSGENEIQNILRLPPKDKERRNLINFIRKRGNYLRNYGELYKPVRSSSNSTRNFLPCTNCLGFFSAKLLYRHRKTCNGNKSSPQSNLFTINNNVDRKLKMEVFPLMKSDIISQEAITDRLICAFGARYIKRYQKKRSIVALARKMRELAEVLSEIKKLQPTIKSLFEALQPKYFSLFIDATKILGKYDEVTGVFASPSFAINVAILLKQCCDVALSLILRNKTLTESSKESKEDLNDMITLLETNWKYEIGQDEESDESVGDFEECEVKDFGERTMDADKNVCDGTPSDSDKSTSIKQKKKSCRSLQKSTTENKKRTLIPWTEEQKTLAKIFFADHIRRQNAPKRSECEVLVEQNGDIFLNKSWTKIKVFIQNEYMKQKKKKR